MVGKARRLTVYPLKSEFLALLKEAEMIREFKPKYNISLKDDKTPSFIVITKNKNNPEVIIVRQNQLTKFNNSDIFGPFLSSRSLRTVLKIAKRIFPYCDRPNQSVNKKPCFYYHLNLCPGICIRVISHKSYLRQIKRLTLFLRGNHQKLLRQLTIDMKVKSKSRNYEAAGKIRDQIEAINNLNTVNAFSEFSSLELSLPGFPIKSGGRDDLFKVDSHAPIKSGLGMTGAQNLKLAARIEGYDISHLQGKWATASMVVFINGKPAKEEYRQFRMEGLPSADDPKMLAEILARRFMHSEWEFPDLIMIDGGEPQLREILRVFEKLPVKLPRMVGLAKGENTIIIPENGSYQRINLPKFNPWLKILMALRDEAHRFARRYHHALRLKSLIGRTGR